MVQHAPHTRHRWPGLLWAAATAILPVTAAAADCPEAATTTAETIAAGWLTATPLAAPDIPDAAFAACVQNALVAALSTAVGEPIGWKVGLTSTAAQEAFGVDQPLTGRLLDSMLLPNDVRVPSDFGARPILEADLIVTIASPDIMQATTALEALASVESFTPFIELPDLVVAQGEPLTANIITAINVGARQGVIGAPFTLPVDTASVEALGSMMVEIVPEGADPMATPGAAILGNPLNALLWLVEDLARRGERLTTGDVVSLGGFGPPLPAQGLTGLTVTYSGLPNPETPRVSVGLE